MRRNNNHSKVDIPDIRTPVEYTRKYGDIIDATPRFYRDIAFQTYMVTQAPALAIANLGSNSPLSGEAMSSFGHSYPLLGIAGLAAGYKINKSRLKREFENGSKAFNAHNVIQEEMPGIDLIRGKDKNLYMHSGLFIANTEGHGLGNDGIRLARRALVAKKHNIDFITIPDFDRLQSHLPRRSGEEFGTVQSGTLYPLRKHGITNPAVHETLKKCGEDSAEQQFELSPDNALVLAAELQKDRVGPLLEHLKNPELTKLYEKMSKKPALEAVFVKKLRGALTRQLGHNESPSKVYRQDLGEGRVDMLYQMTPDNRILMTERETYFENNTQRASVQTKAIHEFFNYKTDGELLYEVVTRDQQRKAGQAPQHPELLLAASLLLMTGSGKEFVDHSLEKKAQTHRTDIRDWTYTRLVYRHQWKGNRYKSPLHRKLVVIAGALVLTHFGGAYANEINAAHHTASVAQSIQEASDSAARHVTNLPKTIHSFFKNNGQKPVPAIQEAHAYSNQGMMGFGEISPRQNYSVFSVESLSGVSTQGYWSAATQDELTIGRHAIAHPFTDAGIEAAHFIEGQETLHTYNADEQDILQHSRPDLHVTLQIDNTKYTTQPLAILQGYEIVGARIVDESRPGSVMAPEISKTPNGENYSIVPYSKGTEYSWYNYGHPRLDYWLKKSTNPNPSPRFIQPMRFPVDHHDGIEVNKKVIANRVHAALGLPDTASNMEVYDSIKSKLYSLQPFTREDIGPIALGWHPDINTEELTDVTARIGETYAAREALLCNLANLALILGTEAEINGVNLNLTQGYMESNGDGHLTFNESHVWTTGEDGRIYDATPSKPAPGEAQLETGLPSSQPTPPKAPFSVEKLLIGAGAVATLALASSAIDYWQRRRRAKAFEMKPSVSSSEPEKPSKLPSRPTRTLSEDYITQALNEINRIMFSQGGTNQTNDRTIQILQQDDPLSEHVAASIPSPGALRRIAQKNGIDYDSIPPDIQAAIKKLHQNRRAITEYLRNTDES